MDARKDLYAFAMKGKEHSPDISEEASEKIDAFRAAVLREAADEVFSLDFDQQVMNDEDLGSVREAWDLGTVHARDELLRMASEKPEASDV